MRKRLLDLETFAKQVSTKLNIPFSIETAASTNTTCVACSMGCCMTHNLYDVEPTGTKKRRVKRPSIDLTMDSTDNGSESTTTTTSTASSSTSASDLNLEDQKHQHQNTSKNRYSISWIGTGCVESKKHTTQYLRVWIWDQMVQLQSLVSVFRDGESPQWAQVESLFETEHGKKRAHVCWCYDFEQVKELVQNQVSSKFTSKDIALSDQFQDIDLDEIVDVKTEQPNIRFYLESIHSNKLTFIRDSNRAEEQEEKKHQEEKEHQEEKDEKKEKKDKDDKKKGKNDKDDDWILSDSDESMTSDHDNTSDDDEKDEKNIPKIHDRMQTRSQRKKREDEKTSKKMDQKETKEETEEEDIEDLDEIRIFETLDEQEETKDKSRVSFQDRAQFLDFLKADESKMKQTLFWKQLSERFLKPTADIGRASNYIMRQQLADGKFNQVQLVPLPEPQRGKCHFSQMICNCHWKVRGHDDWLVNSTASKKITKLTDFYRDIDHCRQRYQTELDGLSKSDLNYMYLKLQNKYRF